MRELDMKNLEETLKDRIEVHIWSLRDWFAVPDPFVETDLSVVATEDRACVIVATVSHVTKRIYKVTKLYYDYKKRRLLLGWKIKYKGRLIHHEPLVAEETL